MADHNGGHKGGGGSGNPGTGDGGHKGGGGSGNPGTGDGGHNGGSHNGNNDQKNNHSGGSKDSSCIPVTLSGLPGQTKPLAICLVTGKDTNVATEIGFATFTLVQLAGGEFRLTINGLNGQYQNQPAIVTLASGATSPITVPGLGRGNVLIGDGYSVILDVPRIPS